MERIGKQVERTLSRSGGGQVLALAELTAAWPTAVGEVIARNAWPLRLARDGTLHVATTSSTWAFELDRLAPEIVKQLGAALGTGAPPKVRFRVGPVPEPGAPSPGPAVGRGASSEAAPEIAAQAESAAAAIADPELRELVSRAARASLAKPRSGRGF